MRSIRTMLKGLTPEDLRKWAGSKIYNRGKDYIGLVSNLSRTEDGRLVAWVSGTAEYATSVKREGKDDFDFFCTCPYDDWGPCKHVVAVLLAAAEGLTADREIPLLAPGDDLYQELSDNCDANEDGCDDDDGDDYDYAKPVRIAVSRKPGRGRTPRIEALLADKNRDELLALLVNLADTFPETARRIREDAQLATGQTDKLVRALRKEIRSLTAEDAWYNPWKQRGNLPDYAHVETQLRTLLANGHAQAVFALGEELWERGVEQVGRSHDEGETAMALAACMEIVVRALPGTSLTPAGQLLWLIDRRLADEYGLLGEIEAVFDDKRYVQEDWRGVATALELRLRNLPVPQSRRFTATYHRQEIMTLLCEAYRRSGQRHLVIPLLEQEADRCRSYEVLVKALLESDERVRARQWCIKGYDQTINDAPGIAIGLQTHLRQMAEGEKQFALAAAYRAEDFFNQPSARCYLDLRKAAEKIKEWPMVRAGALGYLRTGRRPAASSKDECPWPLPEPEVRKPEPSKKDRIDVFPKLEMLIEIALLEKRNDDAVELYRELSRTKRWHWGVDEQLAKAVKASHPEVALLIWKSIADRLIAQVKPSAYREAAEYLNHMREVHAKAGRLHEWTALLGRLRLEHKAKRRLLEVLDELEPGRKQQRQRGMVPE